MIRAQLEDGTPKSVKEARQQMDFLRETHPKVGEESVSEWALALLPSPTTVLTPFPPKYYHFLLALLAEREPKVDGAGVFAHLQTCVDIHFAAHHVC